MFEAVDIEDVAGEQLALDSRAWMRRESIAVEAMQPMLESVARQWRRSERDADTLIDLWGQAFRLGWESHKAAC